MRDSEREKERLFVFLDVAGKIAEDHRMQKMRKAVSKRSVRQLSDC